MRPRFTVCTSTPLNINYVPLLEVEREKCSGRLVKNYYMLVKEKKFKGTLFEKKKKIVNNNQRRTCGVDDFKRDPTGEMEIKRSLWEKSHN